MFQQKPLKNKFEMVLSFSFVNVVQSSITDIGETLEVILQCANVHSIRFQRKTYVYEHYTVLMSAIS